MEVLEDTDAIVIAGGNGLVGEVRPWSLDAMDDINIISGV